MASKTEIKVTLEFLSQTPITDEDLFRQLACKLVNYMPFGELCLIFMFSKLQPGTEDFNKIISDWSTPDNLRRRMLLLKEERMAIFEAEVRHPEPLFKIEYYQNPKP